MEENKREKDLRIGYQYNMEQLQDDNVWVVRDETKAKTF